MRGARTRLGSKIIATATPGDAWQREAIGRSRRRWPETKSGRMLSVAMLLARAARGLVGEPRASAWVLGLRTGGTLNCYCTTTLARRPLRRLLGPSTRLPCLTVRSPPTETLPFVPRPRTRLRSLCCFCLPACLLFFCLLAAARLRLLTGFPRPRSLPALPLATTFSTASEAQAQAPAPFPRTP